MCLSERFTTDVTIGNLSRPYLPIKNSQKRALRSLISLEVGVLDAPTPEVIKIQELTRSSVLGARRPHLPVDVATAPELQRTQVSCSFPPRVLYDSHG